MMAVKPTRAILLTARCLQGIGSSFGTVSGLGMIGSFHYDENVKIDQMSKAMSGLAFGVLVGPISCFKNVSNFCDFKNRNLSRSAL